MKTKRGLFLTNIISKVIEKMVKKRTKPEMEKGMKPFQTGGVTLRRNRDNLFIVNAVIEEFRAEGKTYIYTVS